MDQVNLQHPPLTLHAEVNPTVNPFEPRSFMQITLANAKVIHLILPKKKKKKKLRDDLGSEEATGYRSNRKKKPGIRRIRSTESTHPR